MRDQHDTPADDEAETPATPPAEQPAARPEDEVQGYIQSVEAALPTLDDAQTRPARTVRNPAGG